MNYKPIIFFIIVFGILFYLHFNNTYLYIEKYFKLIFVIFGLIALILPGLSNILGNGTFQEDIQNFMKEKYLHK